MSNTQQQSPRVELRTPPMTAADSHKRRRGIAQPPPRAGHGLGDVCISDKQTLGSAGEMPGGGNTGEILRLWEYRGGVGGFLAVEVGTGDLGGLEAVLDVCNPGKSGFVRDMGGLGWAGTGGCGLNVGVRCRLYVAAGCMRLNGSWGRGIGHVTLVRSAISLARSTALYIQVDSTPAHLVSHYLYLGPNRTAPGAIIRMLGIFCWAHISVQEVCTCTRIKAASLPPVLLDKCPHHLDRTWVQAIFRTSTPMLLSPPPR
jgi:hypothetical protein